MRILVAGGAGFVGSHLCRVLVERGDDVWCVDDLSSGRLANIADLSDRPLFRFVEAGVCEAGELMTLVTARYIDLVIHLASPASPIDYAARPLDTLEANSTGTANLLFLAQRYRARFIYASTSEVYGDPLVHPQPETYWGNVDPIGPRSSYDEGKRFGEALVTAYRGEVGVPAAIARIFNTYGPGMRLDDGRVIPAFIGAALRGEALELHGGGHQTRSFMYIDDLIRGLMHLIDASPFVLDGLVVNIGNPVEVEIADVAAHVSLAMRSPVSMSVTDGRAGDPSRRRPVIDTMRDRFGWYPRIGLVAGLDRTVRWFREQ